MFKKKHTYLVLLVLLFSFSFCEMVTTPISKSVRTLTADEIKLVSSDNDFGIDLFKEVVNLQPEKNVFISPLSVSMALGMTLNGAADSTYQAMKSTLRLNGLTQDQINEAYESLIELLRNLDPKVTFQIANSIWYRNTLTFEKPFIDTNKKYFDALVSGLDFNSPNAVFTINNWVKENTNNKIEEIVDNISPEEIMFLINAIYFKGMWHYQFDKNLTQTGMFTLPDGSQISCDMMSQELECRYLVTDEFQAVDLPYGKGDYYMTIFLPKTNIKINPLINQLEAEKVFSWLGSFSDQQGVVQFPKYKLEYQLQLNDVLTKMGMGIAFDPYKANFTRLYNGPFNAFISSVLHKTFVQVDEEGTEAAAVTSVTVGITSIGGSFYFRADRPFFFFIRENLSNTILFAGKIVKPTFN
jgi:serine protease inhibitor